MSRIDELADEIELAAVDADLNGWTGTDNYFTFDAALAELVNRARENEGAAAERDIFLAAIRNGIECHDFCDVCDAEVGRKGRGEPHKPGCLYAARAATREGEK